MKRIREFLRGVRNEHGITGLETAIVLIAFVVVAAVFAFVVLSTGLFSSERSKETVYAGLSKTRGTMELTGGVIAETDQTNLITVTFDVTLAAGGDQVNLDPASTTNATNIRYNDGSVLIPSMVYGTNEITGNGDLLLEAGEMFEIVIDLTDITGTPPNTDAVIAANQTFTLEIQPPSGSYMIIQRTTPASLSHTIINLN
jgi:flagellin FlaB